MKLNVVLYEPSIIENVGNIARSCLAFNADLHLIRPFGFIWDKSKLKRSSTNHFEQINYFEYDDWEDFMNKNTSNNNVFYYYTRYGKHTPSSIKYDTNKNIYLVFGNEHYGINKEILKNNLDNCIRIPMSKNIICINISNSAAIALYEVSKQNNYLDLSLEEVFNKDW